ncbi:TonB-dependent receptor [Flavobacterium akiainvivens]|uniref:TonB-dependent receptor n=2 Tax=Flavobacterium akiainvivens TaxID=1202724 RepID=A0A0M9VJZ6_9FLAO|nr:TonB-dependent receptor [Flavobacterium akiainvivens]
MKYVKKQTRDSVQVLREPDFLDYLDELSISSYHVNGNVTDAPNAISVLTTKDLQRNNTTDISPVLNTLPGVLMQSGGINTNRISIRGIGARTPYGTNKIRAFYGNIPLTSGDSETTIEDIDLEMMRRVEVIKGPQSSVYGAGLGGAILIEPQYNAALSGSRARTSTTHGSFGMLKNTATYSYASKKALISIGYHNLKTDGWRKNSAYNREGITLAGNVKITKTGTLTYFGNHMYMKAYIPSSVTLDSFNNTPQAAAPTWAASKGFERYTSYMGGVGYDWNVAGTVQNATSLFISGKENYEPRPFDILTQNNTAWGARTQFKGFFDVGTSQLFFIAGAEYFNDGFTGGTFQNLYQDNNGNGTLQGSRLTGSEQKRNFINAFAQARLEMIWGLQLQLGINYNKTQFGLDNTFPAGSASSEDYSYNGIWAPQAAIMYNIGSGTLYASASRGFSMPAIEETLTPDGTINPNIKPESGYNFEVGYKANILKDERLYVEVSLYTMQVNNLLVAQRVGDDQYVGINAGKTLHRGIEASLRYSLSIAGDWRLTPYTAASIGQYEFKEFVNNDVDYSGKELTGVPKNKINGGFTFNMPYGLYVSADYYYVDQIPMNDANSAYADSYNLLNAKAGWNKTYGINNHDALTFSLSVGINNIANTHYASMVLVNATGFNGAQPRYYYPGLPVNYYGNVGVSYAF